jgi:hypothetical protein
VGLRNSLKVLMAVLALAGITGMYLRQVKQIGVLGLTGGSTTGDIGLMQSALTVSGIAFLVRGLVFGLSVLPDAFYRFLAFPNAVAMIGLGYSLWLSTRTETTPPPTAVRSPHVAAAGVG